MKDNNLIKIINFNNFNNIFNPTIHIFEYICYIYALITLLLSVIKTDIFNNTSHNRLILGHSVNLSLTYILVADVIKTVRIPSYYQLGRVVVLVILREFITYTLDREIQYLKNKN